MRPIAPVPHVCRPARTKTRGGRLLERMAAPFLSLFMLVAVAAVMVAGMAASLGVNVNTVARSGNSNILRAPGARYFISVQAEKGDTAKAFKVTSPTEYHDEYGNRFASGFGSDDADCFFNDGGRELWVIRAVGAGATKGTLTVKDGSGGAGLNTLAFSCFWPGATSQYLTVQIDAGALANTFTLTFTYKAGTTDQLQEIYRDLATPAAAVTAINGKSRLVTATNSGSVTAAPANNPRTLVATALSAGTDDAGSITATTMTNALAKFGPDLGPGAVAVPGYDISLIAPALAAHCKANRRVGITHDVVGQTDTGVATTAASYYGVADYEYLCLIHRWVKVSDGNGGTRTVPPTGYVAARRSFAHETVGPWRWPAGDIALSGFLAGVEVVNGVEGVELATADTLKNVGVSCVRNLANIGIELYEWRSLSNLNAYYSLAIRDLMNVFAWQTKVILEKYVFVPITPAKIALIAGELRSLAKSYADADGLTEKRDPVTNNLIDPGYSVSVVGDAPNRKVTANVGLRPAQAAESVDVTESVVTPDQSV